MDWIKTAQQLPGEKKPVLIANRYGIVVVATRKGETWMMTQCTNLEIHYVEWWAELPEHPGKAEKDAADNRPDTIGTL